MFRFPWRYPQTESSLWLECSSLSNGVTRRDCTLCCKTHTLHPHEDNASVLQHGSACCKKDCDFHHYSSLFMPWRECTDRWPQKQVEWKIFHYLHTSDRLTGGMIIARMEWTLKVNSPHKGKENKKMIRHGPTALIITLHEFHLDGSCICRKGNGLTFSLLLQSVRVSWQPHSRKCPHQYIYRLK